MTRNRDLVYAPDGETWYQTALNEAAKRREFAARIETLEAALRKISITIHRDYDEEPVLALIKNIADAALAPEQDK